MKRQATNFLLIVLIVLLNLGCSKEKIGSSISEGLYECWFTDEGKDAQYIPLYLNKIDENTFVINTTNDTAFGPYLKRDKCFIGGVIEGRSCLGEIQLKKGKYTIEGTYSYLEYAGGLGNPNPQYNEVHGTFKLKSNI